MPVDGISNAYAAQTTAAASGTGATQGVGGTSYKRTDVTAASQELTMTDFYKLMAAQMQYQNPDEPMDTSDLMATLVQSKMITAMADLTSTNMITYATSMLGQQVTMAEVDAYGRGTGEYTKGTITGVSLAGDSPILYVGDKSYKLSQIMSVGDVKMANETDKDDNTEEDKTEGADTGTTESETV